MDLNYLITLETLCFLANLKEETDSQKAVAKEVVQLIQIVFTGSYTVRNKQWIECRQDRIISFRSWILQWFEIFRFMWSNWEMNPFALRLRKRQKRHFYRVAMKSREFKISLQLHERRCRFRKHHKLPICFTLQPKSALSLKWIFYSHSLRIPTCNRTFFFFPPCCIFCERRFTCFQTRAPLQLQFPFLQNHCRCELSV